MPSPSTGPVVLAVDYGEKKVGLAVSVDQKTALPLETFFYQHKKELWTKVAQVCQNYTVGQIVLGLPLTAQNKEGQAALAVKKFAARLKQKLNLPVFLQSEYLTTQTAQQQQKKLRKEGVKPLRTEDAISAQLILQDYLQKLK